MISPKQLPTILTAIFLCIASLAMVQTALAADYLVTPLVVNLELEKRDIVEKHVTLINNESRMIRLYATVNNVATNGGGVVDTFMQVVESDRTNTATTWIEISRQRIELKPGETRNIPFIVRMNPETEPGDYNVFIGFAEGSNRPVAESKVRAGEAPGTIVHIAVDQTQNQFLRLRRFSVDKFITKKGTQTLAFTLFNPGGVDIVPGGEVIFYDNSGIEIASLPVNSTGTVVPASKEKSFSMDVPEELSMGKHKAFLSVEYGAHLTASINDTAFFYVIPLKQVIIVFVIVLVFAILIALYLHRRYDIGDDGDGAEYVDMHIREGHSEDQHHDINLTRKDDE